MVFAFLWSSGVGLAAVQLAREAGAVPFATASGGKLSFPQQVGAEHTIDYQKGERTHGTRERGIKDRADVGAGVMSRIRFRSQNQSLSVAEGGRMKCPTRDPVLSRDTPNPAFSRPVSLSLAATLLRVYGTAGPFLPELQEVTKGEGVDLILDCVGASYFKQARLLSFALPLFPASLLSSPFSCAAAWMPTQVDFLVPPRH